MDQFRTNTQETINTNYLKKFEYGFQVKVTFCLSAKKKKVLKRLHYVFNFDALCKHI